VVNCGLTVVTTYHLGGAALEKRDEKTTGTRKDDAGCM